MPTNTADNDLAEYLQKCSQNELSNEQALAEQTILSRREALAKPQTNTIQRIYRADIRFANRMLAAIAVERERRVIP